jgi:hypothetical protein
MSIRRYELSDFEAVDHCADFAEQAAWGGAG